jgi:hypothetical protein
MSNMTPFEIRLELLKMARDMLSEEYHGKREVINSGWHSKVEEANRNNATAPEHPGFPAFPNESEIIAKAMALNGFVSQVHSENVKTPYSSGLKK